MTKRCAVVDENGSVVNIIIADPELDSVESHTLIVSDAAEIGATYLNGEFANPAPIPNPLPVLAKAALAKSDISVIRCISAGIAVPADIHAYRVALRNIATGKDATSTVLPTESTDYPVGT